MTALRKILVVEEEAALATHVVQAPAAKLRVVTGKALVEPGAAAPAEAGGALKNIVLFFAAPFIGLAYLIALPFVGFGFLAVMAARAAVKLEAVKTAGWALKTGGMMIAAALIGLACVVFFPFVGLAVLAGMGGRAMVEAGRGE
ncbi:hypothetical protein [Candidatus Binatus sp.]|uniref:hypothetical protein n=1 Tax=Candidatus Binatus sp. TaxID=2811406 RepID=UPI003F960A1C